MDNLEEMDRLFKKFNLPSLNQEETTVDYKKNMRRSIIGIVAKTLLACFLTVGAYLYFLWELGILDKQVYEAPNGNYRFEVTDEDAGIFEGGAVIVTPDGRGVNLIGDKSYQNFEVWYHPDGMGYFACVTYDDHHNTWLCLSEYDEELGMETNRYFPEGEIAERDFCHHHLRSLERSGTVPGPVYLFQL